MNHILIFPRSACQSLLVAPHVPWSPVELPLHWLQRAEVEEDPAWLQPIPYAVLIDVRDRPWAYRRCGGDHRLLDRRSIGVGGHVDRADDRGALLPTLRAALLRELDEELIGFPRQLANAAPPIAWINEQDSAIGRVHLGLVFAIPWLLDQPPRPRRGEALEGLGFVEQAAVTEAAGYERWSLLAARSLRP